ncbi:LysR family transcriptional regulator [Thalassobius sp. Cn5-15]|uniref:LysR family transcriptional regulator n=1 Tax=Thalassobius sp. Cn5-15 TaxID=2917763 RepID=UPI001EF2CAE2|nr:LysR family transcriptional regulator [Thalassobius sp. Cn5-15]MCG7493666.1 LysR family transcriptional regulator [Thalassobius sp. Cn5-15]
MDLRFVETLIAAVEEASLAGAARRLGVTPAAVSQRVDALEAQLQVPLLLRFGRGMAATPECEALLPELRRMVAIHAGLPQILARDQLKGMLRLGAVSTALADHAADLVQGLKQHAPEVELTLTPGASAELYEAFMQRRLDAALLVAPPFAVPKALRFDPLTKQPVGLLMPKDGAADLPFLLYARAAWGGAMCYRVLQQQFGSPRFLCEMDALETIAQLVEDGVGQAVVPKWAGLLRRHAGVDFTPLGSAQRQVGLLSWQRDSRRPVQQVLRQVLGISQI